jgi:hypothetical protein
MEMKVKQDITRQLSSICLMNIEKPAIGAIGQCNTNYTEDKKK